VLCVSLCLAALSTYYRVNHGSPCVYLDWLVKWLTLCH